jgi:hypothetical protein
MEATHAHVQHWSYKSWKSLESRKLSMNMKTKDKRVAMAKYCKVETQGQRGGAQRAAKGPLLL